MTYHPAVTFIAPYRIYLPDEFFAVLGKNNTNSHVKAVPLPPLSNTGPSQVHGPNIEIRHDIFGFAGRTQYCVMLGEAIDTGRVDWKKDVCERDKEFVDAALEAVNRLLSVYRDRDINRIGVSSFHVIELVRDDLSDITLVVVDNELNQLPEPTVTWPGYRSIGIGDCVIRETSVIEKIRADLLSGAEIPIHREILTSAQNHLWRKQLRLVPVEANTAFESYAFSALKSIDPQNTLPDSSNLFEKLTALDSVFKSAAARNSLQYSDWFDQTIKGWKGLLVSPLKEWHVHCYELRNKIIHKGYNTVTQLEAKEALIKTRGAITFVEQCIRTFMEHTS